jgi:RNAse (barnase) inhibitor barstar
MPGIQGLRVHAVNGEVEPLVARLTTLGFKVYLIQGYKISDKKSFFQEISLALELPEYFEHNWDGLDDVFGELRYRSHRNIAIVWKDADQTFMKDAQILLEAVCVFDNFATYFNIPTKDGSEQVQLEVFLLGHESGFRVQLDLADAE